MQVEEEETGLLCWAGGGSHLRQPEELYIYTFQVEGRGMGTDGASLGKREGLEQL